MPRPLPTPLLAFAIRELGCVAGVMVTASHNPPQDNGYKVYLGDGSQIVPPADAGIAERIAAVGAAGRRPARRRRAGCSTTRSSTATSTPSPSSPPTGRATSTSSTRRCTASAGTSVRPGAGDAPASPRRTRGRQQEQPDADFPTVAVPEPRGAGRDGPRDGARRASSAPTSWSPTTPTPTAARPRSRPARLADAARRRGRRAARRTTCSGAGTQGVYATTIVSSSLLGRMAAAAGQPYAETLTGFKWIGRVDGAGVRLRGGARLLRRPRARAGQGRRLGAAAALRARRRGQGRGPHPRRPARRHRHRARAARHRPAVGAGHRPRGDRPRHGAAARHSARRPSAGSPSSSVDDLTAGSADLPPTDGLRYRLADGARVIVRPERHRAEDQVLPRGGRPGRAPRGRRRRGPDLRGRPARRAGRRHPQGRRHLSQAGPDNLVNPGYDGPARPWLA